MGASELIKDVNAAADGSLGNLEEDQRANLFAACEKLKATLENPLEVTQRVIFGAHQATVLRLAIDLKLFDVVAAATTNGGQLHISGLATDTGADAQLVGRLMRMLAGMGFFKETGPDSFVPTPLAGIYVTGSPLTEVVVHFSLNINILSRLPDYLESKGYKNPGDAFDGPFQYAIGTNLHYFDWLKTNPRQQQAFNTVMGVSRMSRGEEWFGFYPVETKLQVSSDTDTVLVDIGGGLGHDLLALKQNIPNLCGKLVLQDLPIVISAVKDLPPQIEAMPYDFFTTQPVKGAKAYYLRTVLHDWPDKQAREILANIRTAMNKNSILLINENVMPESNAPLYSAQLDLSMMAYFSSLDRTQTQFKDLLDSSGFELVKCWTPKTVVPGSGTLFEAVLK